jgi:hypothetical protein
MTPATDNALLSAALRSTTYGNERGPQRSPTTRSARPWKRCGEARRSTPGTPAATSAFGRRPSTASCSRPPGRGNPRPQHRGPEPDRPPGASHGQGRPRQDPPPRPGARGFRAGNRLLGRRRAVARPAEGPAHRLRRGPPRPAGDRPDGAVDATERAQLRGHGGDDPVAAGRRRCHRQGRGLGRRHAPAVPTASAVEHSGPKPARHATGDLAAIASLIARVDPAQAPNIARLGDELVSGDGSQRANWALDVLLNGILAAG